MALLVARYHGDIRRGPELRAATVTRLLERTDALRRPQRFEQLLQACACDYHGRLGWEEKPIPAPDLFLRALAAARSVDAKAIAMACKDSAQIAERLHAARVAAVREALSLAD
jgi:tRNA nucleotidyltransferase (CCA-adding enzyme)